MTQIKKIFNLSIALLIITLAIDYMIDGEFDLPAMMYHSILSLQHGSHLLPSHSLSQFGQMLVIFYLLTIDFYMSSNNVYKALLLITNTVMIFIYEFMLIINKYYKITVCYLSVFKEQYITISSAIIPLP